MARSRLSSKRTPSRARADRAADELAHKLGTMLRDGRQMGRWTQQQCADRAGISRSQWSHLEVARDGRVTLATLNRAAMALGSSLEAYVRRTSAAGQPRDAVHLRGQELIMRSATGGGWRGLPEELIDREARTSRAADVLLQRENEYAIAEVWDWFDDLGAALREWTRRLDALERYAIARMAGEQPLPRVGGFWAVRATQRNRRLVAAYRTLLLARFPGSGQGWLRALGERTTHMPRESALLWVSVDGRRLFAARVGKTAPGDSAAR